MDAELSFGQKAVGLTFNPSQNPRVFQVKEKYAEMIDILNNAREACGDQESKRIYSLAITYAQTAQMWAVKAITSE